MENSLLFGSHSRTEDIASLRTISKEVTALLSAAEVMISQSHNRAQDLEGQKKMSIQRSSNLQLLGSAPMGGAMGKKRGAPPKPPSAPDKEEKVCCVCCACVRVCPLMVEIYTVCIHRERQHKCICVRCECEREALHIVACNGTVSVYLNERVCCVCVNESLAIMSHVHMNVS